jgi:Fe-S-cluster containining protein
MADTVAKEKLFSALSELYAEMEKDYNAAAEKIGLSCKGCPDNCCRTFFQHHTYIEWAYLWEGIDALSESRKAILIARAQSYINQFKEILTRGGQPRIMCPLNEEGLCQLYTHRLMICRMHGVPNYFIGPDGQKKSFPGCIRCQQLYSNDHLVAVLDRTPHYRKLATLEMTLRGPHPERLPRVNLTIAEMLTAGPPQI